MTNPVLVAQALLAVARDAPGVVEAHLGALAQIPATPAVEVLLGDGRLAQLPASPNTLEHHSLVLLILEAMTPNVATETEETVGNIASHLINTINAPAFDDTLGGLVERTRASSYAFDYTQRNNRAYRVAAVRVEAGEI